MARILLISLALNSNRAVSTSFLMSALWPEHRPGSAAANLRHYVTVLRRALRGTGQGGPRIESQPGAYRLLVRPGELDLTRFGQLAEQGRELLAAGDAGAAAQRLRTALALCAGPILDDPPEALRPGVAAFEERRLAAVEDDVAAQLALGRHRELVGELTEHTARFPTRERLWGQLMLAYYRCDRQADALAAYHRVRQALDQELGIEPGPALRELHQRMLRVDPELGPAPNPADPVPAAGTQRGSVVRRALDRACAFARITQLPASAELVERAEADVAALVLAFPRQPAGELADRVADTQNTVLSLLEVRQKPARAARLYFLAGVLGGLLANACHDLDDPLAHQHARFGLECAARVDHTGLGAWLHGMRALRGYGEWQPDLALCEVHAGLAADRSGRTSTTAWLHALEARIWGRLGNAGQALAAIDRARAAFDRIEPNDVDALGGLCASGQTELFGYFADALAWLPGHPDPAERYAAAAVAGYADPAAADWDFGCQAGAHADLATARARRGDLDGAREAIAPLLRLPPAHRLTGVSRAAHRTATALAALPPSRAARALRHELDLCFGPTEPRDRTA